MKVWWSKSPAPGNLGDVLTPVILAGFGKRFEWVQRRHAEFLCIGSIAKFAAPGVTVIGSGIMRLADRQSPSARYLSVRGPITRSVVLRDGGSCPEVYGDPALLLPHIHDRSVPKTHDIGVVPHYVDEEWVRWRHPDMHVISTLNADPLAVVDQIRACRVILSSSLHGLVVAHAYGIPAAWVRFSDKLSGDGSKFRDHAASVNVEMVPYSSIYDAKPVVGEWDARPLLEVFQCL